MVSRLFDLEDAPSLQSDIALKSFLMMNLIRSAVYSIVLLVFLILTKKEKKIAKSCKCTDTVKSHFNPVIHKILSFKPSDSDARRYVSFLRSLCIVLYFTGCTSS